MHKEKEALKEFETILKKYQDPELIAGVKMWFGEYFYNKGGFDVARKHFNWVISKYPDSDFVDDAFYWLAWTLYEEGKPKQAIREFKTLYKNYPNSEWSQEAMFRTGDILFEQGKINEALNEFNLVTAKYDGTSFARTADRKIGHIFMDKGDFLKAIECFKRALTATDTDFNAQIQYDIAKAYALKGDSESAVIEYLKVSYMYPQSTFWSARAELKCAALLERMQRWEQAIKVYERLAKRDVKESSHARERLEWLRLKR